MDTARVDICYRPLRIAWAIRSDDREGLRRAVRLTHTMWGGRFNPIVFADRLDEARQIIELFRADMVVSVGCSAEVKEFPARFSYLISPLFPDELFLQWQDQHTRAHVLDIDNAFTKWRGTPDWQRLAEEGIWFVQWADADPLADSFLVQYGAYPEPAQTGIDYGEMLSIAASAGGAPAIAYDIHDGRPLPAELLDHPTVNYLSRCGLSRHYTVQGGWDYPGVFVGDASNLPDLVTFWNLRAADVQLQFVDLNHRDRYAQILPVYEQRTRSSIARLDDHRQKMAVWAGEAVMDDALKAFGNQGLTACRLFPGMWQPGVVRPPMMIFGEESALGVSGTEQGKPKVSFAFHAKPYCGDNWFHTQHLVASVAIYGGDEEHTFRPPYVPEWNEFLARSMYFEYNKLRIEPERVGLVIGAADHDAFLYVLPVPTLIENLFDTAGLSATLSGGGLITRQLISRVGGLGGARVFKIPGVRRLLKTYGPTASFTRNAALQLIGRKDPNNPSARFEDHKDLYIESRPLGTKLTPAMVFEYLVEKGLFRIGVELTCPTCRLNSWIALDVLRQTNVCDLCGAEFDGSRQLVRTEFRYWRTGVLGLERNIQGRFRSSSCCNSYKPISAKSIMAAHVPPHTISAPKRASICRLVKLTWLS
jgi:hypothetical protein